MDRANLTPREQQLLEVARRNPDSREGQGKLLIGFASLILVISLVGLWADPRPGSWQEISTALVWMMFAVTTWESMRFQSTAWSLIAKLDGSYADAVPPAASALGLAGANLDPTRPAGGSVTPKP